jgi:hypothetical protein
MKTLAKLSKAQCSSLNNEPKVVEFITVWGGVKQIPPSSALSLICPFCEGKDHYTCLKDPTCDGRKVWICADIKCKVNDIHETKKHIKIKKLPHDEGF